MKHSLYSKNFCHRTPKNSKYSLQQMLGVKRFLYCYLFSCEVRVFCETIFILKMNFAVQKYFLIRCKILLTARITHILVSTKNVGYKFLVLGSRFVGFHYIFFLRTASPSAVLATPLFLLIISETPS